MSSSSRCKLPLDSAQEALDLQESFGLLSVRAVRAILKEHPLASGDALPYHLLFSLCAQVVAPGKQQCRDADLSKARADIQLFKMSAPVHFTGSLPGWEHLRA